MKAVSMLPTELLRLVNCYEKLSILTHKIYNALDTKSTRKDVCVHLARVEHVAYSNLRLLHTSVVRVH
jgi:hypothetical protein